MCVLKPNDGIMMMCRWKSQDDDGIPMCVLETLYGRYGEQKMARFRTLDFTKDPSYVSTPSGKTAIESEMIEKKCQNGLIEYSRMQVYS